MYLNNHSPFIVPFVVLLSYFPIYSFIQRRTTTIHAHPRRGEQQLVKISCSPKRMENFSPHLLRMAFQSEAWLLASENFQQMDFYSFTEKIDMNLWTPKWPLSVERFKYPDCLCSPKWLIWKKKERLFTKSSGQAKEEKRLELNKTFFLESSLFIGSTTIAKMDSRLKN